MSAARTALPLLLVPIFLLHPAVAQPPEEHVRYTATAVLENETFPLSVSATGAGPLFPLAPLAARLGGRLKLGAYGEAQILELGEVELVFGPESPVITQGEEILSLSQPPQIVDGGLKVPLDFLRHTFGQILGYQFLWDRDAATLTIERHAARELEVTADLVHLQGTTTLVFEFPRPPRYRVRRQDGALEVEILGDRLASSWRAPPGDPLVREVEIGARRIRVALAPGATADHYTLEQPFRLVFDVHPRPAAGAAGPGLELEPPRPHRGLRTIVIDPGHGGSETGALGPSGVAEKDLVLLLARALKNRLEARLPVKVVLTRSEDANLPLTTRTAIANQNKADLFISLHLNSSYGPGAHGTETYILSLQASDERAASAAAEENASAAEGRDGAGADPLYDLQLILWDLAQSYQMGESQRFANLIQDELNQALDLRDRGVKQAPFRVLMGAAMPAVLVELGFLSNPEEETRLQDPAYRAELVEALARAVLRYRSLIERGAAPESAESPP